MPNDRTIFIVEDDPLLRRGLTLALRESGYRVRALEHGAALLAELEGDAPDVLVLDVMMPGINGLEVLTRLRREPRWSDVPVVVITALVDARVLAAAWAGGAADVLPKPFRLFDLVERIRRLEAAAA